MILVRGDLQIPVIVDPKNDGADVYIPDLEMTIHGSDFCDCLAKASLRASAIYYYNKERNIKVELTCTYEDAQRVCTEKYDKDAFVTFVCLTT